MIGPTRQVVAVVLAGGSRKDPLAAGAGVPAKALVPMAGKPLASYVVDALLRSRSVSKVVYVGPGAESLADGCLESLPGGEQFAHSLALGLGAAMASTPGARLLVVTADIPWVTPSGIDAFVADAHGIDLAYPIVPEAVALKDFPDQRRTFVRLKQGRFTGGNLMLLEPTLVSPVLGLIDRVYRARKNPVALAVLVGFRTLVALLLGRADLPRLERLVSDRLGGRARAIISDDAALSADVDRPDQLRGHPPGSRE